MPVWVLGLLGFNPMQTLLIKPCHLGRTLQSFCWLVSLKSLFITFIIKRGSLIVRNIFKLKKYLFLCAALFCISAPTYALDQVVGKVTVVSASYMPVIVHFQMDAGGGGCEPHSFIAWNKGDPDNHKAVLATLNAALLSQRTVVLYVHPGTCTPEALHFAR